MKKVLAIILCLSLVLSTVAFAGGNTIQAIVSDLKVKLNGQDTAAKNPVIINNTTYLPVSEMSKLAGKLVYYDEETKSIYILEDGNYKSYVVGKHGWVQQMEVAVLGGDITGVVYNEYKTKGKSQNVNGYADKFPKVLKFDEFEKQLVEKQDPSKVDAITGATLPNSYPQFIDLAKKAVDEAKAKKFADGVYDPYGEVDERGYFPMIEVTYRNGKIAAVSYDEYTTTVNAATIDHVKPDDKAYVESFKAVRKLPNLDLAKSYAAWAKDFEEADSVAAMKLNEKADAVAGVTHSFTEFKELARHALMSGRLYADGLYKAEAKEYSHGWKYKLEFTVKSGKITDVKFDGYNEKGIAKTSPEGNYAAYEKVFGISIGNQYKKIADGLVKAQTPDGVDKVVGATHSWAEFKELVKEALENGPVK